MHRTSKLGLGLALLALAGGAGAFLSARRPPSALTAGGSRAPGRQRLWRLALEVALEQPGHPEPILVTLRGDWMVTVSDERESEYDVACQVAGAEVTGEGGAAAAPADVEALRRRLGRRFWVTYRRDGAVLRVHFPRDMDPSDRNLLQMIATETQLVQPDRAAAQWTALERDGAGLALVAYQRTAPGSLTKRKLEYTEVDGAGAEGPGAVAVEIVSSERHFTLDAAGELLAFDGSERMRLGMPMGQGGRISVRTATRLSDPRTGAAPELAHSLEAARPEVDSSAVRTQEPDPEQALAQRDRRLLEGHTAQELLGSLETADGTPAQGAQLAALFRRHPESISAGLEQVRRAGGKKALTDALANAATPEAIAALCSLALDRTAPLAARVDALTAFVLVPRPSLQAMRAPIDLLDDGEGTLRHAAELTSGTLARTGRKEHPAEAAELDEQLLARYSRAKDAESRGAFLSALGNSAGPRVLPAMERALGDERPEVRIAAARALRLADAPEVDDLLARAITGDRDPRVRAAAIFAASFREGDALVEPLIRAATGDAVEYVRGGAVSLLRRQPVTSSPVHEALAQVAAHDPKPGIRRLAQEALSERSPGVALLGAPAPPTARPLPSSPASRR